jgi:hypothetical protein
MTNDTVVIIMMLSTIALMIAFIKDLNSHQKNSQNKINL